MSLKILVQPYNNYAQNAAGGVQTRIRNYLNAMSKLDCQIEIFDKTLHKVQDWDIIHFFKLSIEHYELMRYAKNKGVKIAVSSIVPLRDSLKIRIHRCIGKILPMHTILDMNGVMLELSDVILPQTEAEAKFIKKNYLVHSVPFKVIPNGISPNIINGNPSLAEERYGSKPYVLQVGRVDSNKNQLNVIRALKGLDIPLIIVGGPDPAEPSYFELCKQEAGNNVIFTGWISQDSPLLASLFAASKVVILPSFNEIYGNAVFEGGATNNNIVYSKNLDITEYNLIDKGAKTIDPDNIEDIRKAIIEAYQKPVNPVLKNYIMQNFTWESIAKKHLEIFTNVVNNG